MSDIHGRLDMFEEVLEKINLKDSDTLYILGDVIDRGPNPVKILLKLMEMPNVICLVGNHELMAAECLTFLMKEITDMSIEELDEKTLNNLVTWQYNGSKSTIDEFLALDRETRVEVIEFIKDFSIFEELTVNDTDYILVHAGLGNFSKDKDLEDYSLYDLVWPRADYEIKYFDDIYVISGHTPTQLIEENPNPGFIYRANNHIAIDCGTSFPGGRLAALCLETGEEFYSTPNPEEYE